MKFIKERNCCKICNGLIERTFLPSENKFQSPQFFYPLKKTYKQILHFVVLQIFTLVQTNNVLGPTVYFLLKNWQFRVISQIIIVNPHYFNVFSLPYFNAKFVGQKVNSDNKHLWNNNFYFSIACQFTLDQCFGRSIYDIQNILLFFL